MHMSKHISFSHGCYQVLGKYANGVRVFQLFFIFVLTVHAYRHVYRRVYRHVCRPVHRYVYRYVHRHAHTEKAQGRVYRHVVVCVDLPIDAFTSMHLSNQAVVLHIFPVFMNGVDERTGGAETSVYTNIYCTDECTNMRVGMYMCACTDRLCKLPRVVTDMLLDHINCCVVITFVSCKN